MRFIGIVLIMISFASGMMFAVISVSIAPGAITLHVMLRPASSTASAFVAAMIPPLEAE